MPINAPVFIWLYQFPLGAIAGRYLSGHPGVGQPARWNGS